MDGFLNLNKPAGITSHDCVAKVRRLLHLKRVGHGGTLDPAATGVLPIALGKATRLLQFLRQEKAYQAIIRLGISTNTDDLEGETLATQAVTGLTLKDVKAALQQFQGTIQQVPPNYSAIQVQGKRLYELARAGEKIEVPARKVEIYHIEVLDWRFGEFPEVDVAIACGSGTYIRAIARDLGIALGTGGVLASLIRTESCGFRLADSLTFEQLEAQLQEKIFQPIPPIKALAHLAIVTLPATSAQRWCQGQRIIYQDVGGSASSLHSQAVGAGKPRPENENRESLRVHGEDGLFLGIGQLVNSDDGELLIPQMVFESPQ